MINVDDNEGVDNKLYGMRVFSYASTSTLYTRLMVVVSDYRSFEGCKLILCDVRCDSVDQVMVGSVIFLKLFFQGKFFMENFAPVHLIMIECIVGASKRVFLIYYLGALRQCSVLLHI